MRLEENLRDAYNYTVKLFKDIGRLVILIVLNIIPIVNFIVYGYFAGVIRESPGSDTPPPLEKYGALWVDGAKIFVVTLVYMIVPLVLILAGMFSAILAGVFFPMIGLGILGSILVVVGIILMFLIMIIALMAIIHMAKSGELGSAFEFSKILSKIRAIGWSNYIIWVVIIFVIGLILAGISSIPYIGWLISLILSPVFMVFIGRSASNIYESAATSFCGYCGNPLKPGDKFCGKCGRPVK